MGYSSRRIIPTGAAAHVERAEDADDDPAASGVRRTPRPAAPAAQAFGRVILLGEHAVVHGVPAIAVAVDCRATARVIARAPGAPSRLRIDAWDLDVAASEASHVGHALSALLAEAGEAGVAVDIEVSTALPRVCGLGASAALGVAIARALLPAADDARVAAVATAWERVFHGDPSGVDVAVAAHGGAISFRRGAVPVAIACPPLLLCIGASGAPARTGAMIRAVADARTARPADVEAELGIIGALVASAGRALGTGDLVTLGRAMNENHAVLTRLGISTPALERLTAGARDVGALGAKLTGAGGGGCVVALAPDRERAERVIGRWRADGFEGLLAPLAPPRGAPLVAPASMRVPTSIEGAMTSSAPSDGSPLHHLNGSSRRHHFNGSSRRPHFNGRSRRRH